MEDPFCLVVLFLIFSTKVQSFWCDLGLLDLFQYSPLPGILHASSIGALKIQYLLTSCTSLIIIRFDSFIHHHSFQSNTEGR